VRAEDAEADAEQKSTEVKQGQRETDYAIKKYRDFADHMEGKYLGLQKLYAALGERVDVLQASEVNCRVELAGVKQDNVHLHEEAVRLREEVESLKARIAFLEGTGP
jgi:predicted  nucleic acid-binding Zn-ribbon protein